MKHLKNPAQDGIDAVQLENINRENIKYVLKVISEILNEQDNSAYLNESGYLSKKKALELVKDSISLGEDFDCFEE